MAVQEDREDLAQMLDEWLNHQNLRNQFKYGLLGRMGEEYRFARLSKMLIRMSFYAFLLLIVFSIFNNIYMSGTKYTGEASRALEKCLALPKNSVTLELSPSVFGDWCIPKLELRGSKKSFFSELRADKIEGSSSISSGVFQKWEADSLSLYSLSIALQPIVEQRMESASLREEYTDEDSVEKTCRQINENALLPLFDSPKIKDLKIESFNLCVGALGESDSIEHAQCSAKYKNGQWRLLLTNGIIHSAMAGNGKLVSAEVIMHQDGRIVIESCHALIGKDKKTPVALSGEIVRDNQNIPVMKLNACMTNVPLSRLSPSRLSPGIIDGCFDIKGTISGEALTPSSWKASFNMESRGVLTVKDAPLLVMLDSILGGYMFRAVSCTDAEWHALFDYGKACWKISDICIRSEKISSVVIRGDLTCRSMTDLEWKIVRQNSSDAVDRSAEEQNADSLTDKNPDLVLSVRYSNESSGGKFASKEETLLTRDTRFVDGKLSLSFPMDGRENLFPVLQKEFRAQEEDGYIVLPITVHEVAGEVTRAAAQKLQQSWVLTKNDRSAK